MSDSKENATMSATNTSARAVPSVPDTPTKKEKTAKDKAAERLQRREKAVMELVSTEETYNKRLGMLIDHFVKPLSDYKLITTEQHQILFPQIELIKGLSDTFLADLKKQRLDWDPSTSKLSDIFDAFTPYFKSYQGYVNNHEKAVTLMREKLNEREKWVEYCKSVRSLCNGSDLGSLLILSIQRLPRYRLLLGEIVKCTPDSHPDAEGLKRSLAGISAVADQINSRMKEFERREKVKKIERKFDGNVQILQPHRELIREGKLWKVCRNKDRLYHFFLFNDILIYGTPYGSRYKLHNQLRINEAFTITSLSDASQYGAEKNGRIFTINSDKKSFVAYADTTKEADQWMGDFNQCIVGQSQKPYSSHGKNQSKAVASWVPDAHATTCSLCNDKFTFMNRRHHCRTCGRLVCGKCSKYKLPNWESVMQRACKSCYFENNKKSENDANGGDGGDGSAESKSKMDDDQESESDTDDDFEDENAALHAITYYVDNADESLKTEDIFNKFGHGVGSYVLVPADQSATKSDYYCVTLVVYTQTGFESFSVSLFEKKGAMMFRLESRKLKKKDFNDMNGLIAYIEKKEKLIFSYAIPRQEVETAMQQQHKSGNSDSQWVNTPVAVDIDEQQMGSYGLGNYPKARALYDYEAEVHGDLTLRAGDIIYITAREEGDGWWTGQIGSRSGLFPSTYVEVIEERAVPSIRDNEPTKGDVLVAQYDYNEGGAEELAFQAGDRIVLQAKDESGWWLGKLQRNGVVGWFAPDLVAPLNDEQSNRNTKPTPSTTPQCDTITQSTKSSENENGNATSQSKKPAFAFDESDVANSRQSFPSSPKKRPIRVDPAVGYRSNSVISMQQTTTPQATSMNSMDDYSDTHHHSKITSPSSLSKTSTSIANGADLDEKGTEKEQQKTRSKTNKTKKPPPPKAGKTGRSPSRTKSSPPPPPPQMNLQNGNSLRAQPPESSDDSKESYPVIPYEQLKAKQFGSHNVLKAKLELYLSTEEFRQIFQMTKSEFDRLPKWKKISVKKKVGLF